MTAITSLAQVDHKEIERKLHARILAKLARGEQIVYGDPEYPGETILEYPDGRRVTIDVTPDITITEIREIPPRKDPARLPTPYPPA